MAEPEYAVEARPTSIYQVPWGPARQPDASRGAPDSSRPTLFTPSPRRVRVASRTRTLRAPVQEERAPAQDRRIPAELWEQPAPAQPPSAPTEPKTASSGAIHGRAGTAPDPAGVSGRETSWQLAGRAWEDSGVVWEAPPAQTTPVQSPAAPSEFVPPSPFTPSHAFAAPRLFGSAQPYDAELTLERATALGGPTAVDQPVFDQPARFRTRLLAAPVAPAPALDSPALAPDEVDDLFTAWQGAGSKKAGRHSSAIARRPARVRQVGQNGRAWQVVKVGVPAAVILTVGAGALLMLTGRADTMFAERAGGAALSSGKPTSGPAAARQTGGGPAGLRGTGNLPGYPAEHGTVAVVAQLSAHGTTIAVGEADNHPAVWRRAADGTWSLESTALLDGLTGRLTSVAHSPSGWIAAGTVNEEGKPESALFTSADGVTWQQLATATSPS